MRIAIIGAGFSGIASAKNLRDFGHDVDVYEKCPDVGGVWSSTRRYPGLGTQNGRDTYHLSDMPMPSEYPEWPSSAQVQRYLELYVVKHELTPHIHLECEVTVVKRPPSGRGWSLTITRPDAIASTDVDHVIVANGTFSEGCIPHFAGLDEYRSGGGRVAHTSDYSQLDSLQGKHILVVGYGRSSCDIAHAIAETSASTTVVARKVIWKLPRKLLNVLNYKFLLLTRFGESLFKYIDPSPMESFLHGWGSPLRKGLFGSLGAVIKRQLTLVELGLLPEGGFERIASSTISLSTEGFYERLHRADKLFVKRNTQIQRLFVSSDGKPMARLSTGEEVRADVVICGTGFHQRASFLPRNVQDKLMDANGNWVGLYRHILPIGIPDLTFNGYNSSLFCATSSEVAALWIAAHLEGDMLQPLPSEQEQSKRALARFHWLEEKAHGKTAHGTNTVPFSLRPIDDLLLDLRMDIPFLSKLRQWLLPVNPSAYQYLNPELRKRVAAKHQAQASAKKIKTL